MYSGGGELVKARERVRRLGEVKMILTKKKK